MKGTFLGERVGPKALFRRKGLFRQKGLFFPERAFLGERAFSGKRALSGKKALSGKRAFSGMWPSMVTLSPMVLEETMLLLDIFKKSDFMFTRYFDPIMMSSNTMGIMVTMGEHMSLCNHGLRPFCLFMTSRGYIEVILWLFWPAETRWINDQTEATCRPAYRR